MAKKGQIEFQTHMKNDDGFKSHVINDETNLWGNYFNLYYSCLFAATVSIVNNLCTPLLQ